MDVLANFSGLADSLTAVVVAFITFGISWLLLKTVFKNPGIPAVVMAVVVGGLVYYAAHGGMSDMGAIWKSFVDTYIKKPK